MTVDELYKHLLRDKPRGWSVTRSDESLIVRPPDRSLCKFRLDLSKGGKLAVGRFDRALNHWTGHQYIEPESLTADSVFGHLQRRAGDR